MEIGKVTYKRSIAWNAGRVRSRIAPAGLESPRGYLCRAAACFSYDSALWLTDLANFARADDLELTEKVDELAYALRLDPDQWRSMLYLKVREGNGFWRRQYFGQLIAANRLNYGAPRVCPACLRETTIWWGIWDLAIVSACPGHRCELISTCWGCGEQLTWRRPGVELCRCGYDLRETETVEAPSDLVAINAAVHQSAGFPIGIGSFDLGSEGFPAGLEGLALDDLIGLILASSALQRDPRQPLKPAVTDLGTAQRVAHEAAYLFKEWPYGFHDRLRALLPDSVSYREGATFRGVYGDFYQYLLDSSHHAEFKFMIDAFDEFVAQSWPGVIRGQHRLLSQSARDKMRLIPALQAADIAGLTAPQITELVRERKLAGAFVNPPKSRARVECWIDRNELAQWVASRDSDLAGFISQAEAMQLLGLTATTLRSLARCGLIEMSKGPDRGFPPGVYVCRQDVERIMAAFSNGTWTEAASNGYKSILLREALRRHLGRDGLSEFIRAVLSCALAPVGRDTSVAGILGFQFRLGDVKRYALAKTKLSVPFGLLTYAMAAAALKTNTEVVRNLVAEDLLECHQESPGGIKLLCAQDVEEFASRYVTVKSIAERFEVGTRTVSETLKQHGAEVLVIPLPGKGNKLFVRKGPKSDLAVRCLLRRKLQESG